MEAVCALFYLAVNSSDYRDGTGQVTASCLLLKSSGIVTDTNRSHQAPHDSTGLATESHKPLTTGLY